MPKAAKNTAEPNFAVKSTSIAKEQLKSVPPLLQRRVTEHLRALEREGCRVAGYSLSGDDPWPKLCSKHIDGWRVIVAFPDPHTVVIVWVGTHDPHSDPYRSLAQLLGLPVSTAPRTKPPCCDDGIPPIDVELVERVESALHQLGRGRRTATTAGRRRG